ncbi:hypothetical protein TRICI_002423 [Trichomonascus ciferrii]|uniref:WW domain-containing protein n=1 Tax=Trichomonascus ciferrii TaxID=44093 RepID=A0A642VBP1_9ASCO|nr:hypothetical protein TRICI_002423 [Trichomonascus ciferrii]
MAKKATKDRPKLKIPLTGEWELVFCRSGRRFYHNSVERRSVWFPPTNEVQSVVDGIDKDTMLKLIAHARGLGAKKHKLQQQSQPEPEPEPETQPQSQEPPPERKIIIQEESEEEEDDNESSEEEPMADGDNSSSEGEPIDVDGLDESEDELSPEEKETQFHSLLDSVPDINPYAPWETVMNRVIEDDRYDVYDSGKQRQESYDRWAKNKIAEMKTQKPTQTNISPEQEFLEFVKSNFSSKLFYLEFKRKHRKQPAFKNALSDKERENLYRQFSSWMKKPAEQRSKAHKELLNSAKTNPQSDPRYFINP